MNDCKTFRNGLTLGLDLPHLLCVIIVVHQSAINVCNIETIVSGNLFWRFSRINHPFHDVVDTDTPSFNPWRTTKSVFCRYYLSHWVDATSRMDIKAGRKEVVIDACCVASSFT